jgi:hypothetical protein
MGFNCNFFLHSHKIVFDSDRLRYQDCEVGLIASNQVSSGVKDPHRSTPSKAKS